MTRWAPGTPERLRAAALELFEEKGFAATTVPEIATRAGLTTRTFFRHFSDKREVFFGDDEIPRIAGRLLDEASPGTGPIPLIIEGLRILAAERFEPRRAEMRAARRVIDADPSLQERDLRKQAELREAIRAGFVRRGVDPLTSRALAGFAVELFQATLEDWLADEADRPMAEHLEATRAAMAEVWGGATARA